MNHLQEEVEVVEEEPGRLQVINLAERRAQTPDAPTARFSLRPIHLILIALLSVVSLCGVYFAISHRTPRPAELAPTKPGTTGATDVVKPTEAQLKQVSVETVNQRTISEDRDTTGRVGFNEDRQTPVFTPYAGRVLEVLASKGDGVKAGQPLVIIESPDVVAAWNDLTAARSDADKARLALDLAEKSAERAQRLGEREAISTKDLQQAENDLARAREEKRRAETAVAIAENKLALFGKSADEVKQAGGRLSELKAVDRRLVIRAPLSGTIVERKVGPGQFVKTDAPDPMFLIADLSTLWVQADVFEKDLAAVRVGEPVEVSVDAYPDRPFPARISFVSPTVDATTRTVRVRAVVANAGGALKPDMFARIKIGGAVTRSVPVVPASAVVVEGSTALVFVEEAAGKFRKREVQIGSEQNGEAVVRSGLQAGERVITRGALLLNNRE